MSRESRVESAFTGQRQAVLMAAGVFYRGYHAGEEVDESVAFSHMSNVVSLENFGRSDVTPRIAQIELTSAARAAGRLAYQLDRSEERFADLQGSLPQKIVRFAGNKVMGLEVSLTRIAERAYIRPAEIEGGVVDTLRGIKPKSAA